MEATGLTRHNYFVKGAIPRIHSTSWQCRVKRKQPQIWDLIQFFWLNGTDFSFPSLGLASFIGKFANLANAQPVGDRISPKGKLDSC